MSQFLGHYFALRNRLYSAGGHLVTADRLWWRLCPPTGIDVVS